MSILEEVRTILEQPEAKETDRLEEDLGLDSLDRTEMVFAFEDKFQLTIPDKHAAAFKTVGDIVKYIEEKKK
jgi:acyl carrier protein